jgi:hypothetical protein
LGLVFIELGLGYRLAVGGFGRFIRFVFLGIFLLSLIRFLFSLMILLLRRQSLMLIDFNRRSRLSTICMLGLSRGTGTGPLLSFFALTCNGSSLASSGNLDGHYVVRASGQYETFGNLFDHLVREHQSGRAAAQADPPAPLGH